MNGEIKIEWSDVIIALNFISYAVIFAYFWLVRMRISESANNKDTSSKKTATQTACRVLNMIFVTLPTPFLLAFLGKIPASLRPLWSEIIPNNLLLVLCIISFIGMWQVNRIWVTQYGKKLVGI